MIVCHLYYHLSHLLITPLLFYFQAIQGGPKKWHSFFGTTTLYLLNCTTDLSHHRFPTHRTNLMDFMTIFVFSFLALYM